MTFGKFFASCFTGSMVGSGSDVFAVWAYVIAHAVSSQVELNPRLLAVMIGVSEERVLVAVNFLCTPDPRSRNKEEGGRRLVKEGEFAYRVVSHEIYRKIRDEQERREYMRSYMRERRRSKSSKKDVNNGKPQLAQLAHTEAEAEAEAEERGEGKTATPPPPDPIFGKDPEPVTIANGRKRVPVSDVDRLQHAGAICKREDLGGWQLLVDDHGVEKITLEVRATISAGEKPWLSTIQRRMSGSPNGERRLPEGLPEYIHVNDGLDP